MLSEEEARGYWGPGVFVTANDPQEPWSLTQRAAYRAGGLDPLERGDPVSTDMANIKRLTESTQKVACLPLMNQRQIVPRKPSPMLMRADPA